MRLTRTSASFPGTLDLEIKCGDNTRPSPLNLEAFSAEEECIRVTMGLFGTMSHPGNGMNVLLNPDSFQGVSSLGCIPILTNDAKI